MHCVSYCSPPFHWRIMSPDESLSLSSSTVTMRMRENGLTRYINRGQALENKKDKDTFAIMTARKRSLGQGNIFTGVCLSTGCVSVRGVSVRGREWGLCPERCLCQGGPRASVQRWGSLSSGGGVSVQGGLCLGRPPSPVKSGRYASCWNALFFLPLVNTKITYFL